MANYIDIVDEQTAFYKQLMNSYTGMSQNQQNVSQTACSQNQQNCLGGRSTGVCWLPCAQQVSQTPQQVSQTPTGGYTQHFTYPIYPGGVYPQDPIQEYEVYREQLLTNERAQRTMLLAEHKQRQDAIALEATRKAELFAMDYDDSLHWDVERD